ncbi:MAG: hypothetical protein K9J17_08140 [Flavobacteriales bacterium]|nr:hypothetical protein [Flavobacteriales bacterium]
MRVVGHIPHPSITITIFEYNEKYTVKMEAGPMEQSYKITIDQIENLGNLHKLIDAPFLTECIDHFNAMYLSWKSTIERHQGS